MSKKEVIKPHMNWPAMSKSAESVTFCGTHDSATRISLFFLSNPIKSNF